MEQGKDDANAKVPSNRWHTEAGNEKHDFEAKRVGARTCWAVQSVTQCTLGLQDTLVVNLIKDFSQYSSAVLTVLDTVSITIMLHLSFKLLTKPNNSRRTRNQRPRRDVPMVDEVVRPDSIKVSE
jgi:hypothetical protein